jgi:hypothetical protein
MNDDFKPGDFCGPYKILAFIDEGGFAAVWAARHELYGRLAAVKTLRTTR